MLVGESGVTTTQPSHIALRPFSLPSPGAPADLAYRRVTHLGWDLSLPLSLYKNIYIYIYTYIHTYIYIHMHIHMYMCISLSLSLYEMPEPPALPGQQFAWLTGCRVARLLAWTGRWACRQAGRPAFFGSGGSRPDLAWGVSRRRGAEPVLRRRLRSAAACRQGGPAQHARRARRARASTRILRSAAPVRSGDFQPSPFV